MKNLHAWPAATRFGARVALVMLTASLSGCGGGSSGVSAVIVPTATATSIPTTASTPTATSSPVVDPTFSPTPIGALLRVACVGDSITEGSGLPAPTTNSYPAVLGQWLHNQYQVRNFGAAGTTLLNSGSYPYQGTAISAQAVWFKPDILVVALGTNDRRTTFDSANKTNFERDYKTLITAFKAANSKVKIYICLPPPAYGSQQDLDAVLSKDILPLIRRVALSEGAQVIDLNTLLSNHAELYRDEVHPNVKGMRLIAGEVYRVLTGKQPPA